MSDYFVFGGIDSRNYGIAAFNMQTEDSAAREQTKYSVPGRDGDLISTQTRLKNRSHEYAAIIYQNFATNIKAFRDAIMSKRGYHRLTDSFHTDEFYLARYVGPVELQRMNGSGMGKVLVEFDRKPQRYLVSGDTGAEVADGGKVTNPTLQPARPLIRVYGYGTLEVGSDTITIAQHSHTYIDIDSDIMDCFSGTANCNSLVSFQSHEFPVLPAGDTTFDYSGNITKVEVTPRWWRL